MKKLISILLVAVMVFSLAACGHNTVPSEDPQEEAEVETPAPEVDPTDEPQETEVAEETASPEDEKEEETPVPDEKESENEEVEETPEPSSEPTPTVTETPAPTATPTPAATEQPGEVIIEDPQETEALSEIVNAKDDSEGKTVKKKAGLNGFTASTLSEMFSGLGQKNRVYSPMNVYLALAMLADVTDGETREQILDVLGQSDIDALHKEARKLIKNNTLEAEENSDFPKAVILPAASFWLRDGVEYNSKTLKKLEDNYDASAFSGKMGSPEYSQQLRDWVNEKTNKLLEKQASGLGFDADQLMALVTTLYFKANWSESFAESATNDDVFHGAAKKETVPFMHKTESVQYYRGENFAAICINMNSGADMWFLLPDEGSSIDDLMKSDEAIKLLTSSKVRDDCEYKRVKMSIPKFDVDSDMDLCAMFAKLGVTDVFDPAKADFSPLTDIEELAVTDIEHAARVKIDEEGCEAAAFTVIAVKATGLFKPEEPIEFNVDRPFFFAVTGPESDLLFTGAVNTIAGK